MRPSSKAILPALLVVALCALLLSPAQTSVAATSYVLTPTDPTVGSVCASLGGTWDGSTTCTLSSDLSLNPGDSLLVDYGAVLVIPVGIAVINNGSIDDYGAITNDAGGSVANSGTITAFIANGTITNEGSFTNDLEGSVTIQHLGQASVHVGSFNFTNTGTFNNAGTFLNFGNFTSRSGASITNSGEVTLASATLNIGKFSAPVTSNFGDFTNAAGGSVTIDGATFNSTGTLTNFGTIAEEQNVFSAFNSAGTFTNNGTLSDESSIYNSGALTNSGAITIEVGCAVVSCGSLVNDGSLVNTPGGSIDNQGNFGNNNLNPRRPQLGTFTNEGLMNNSDVFVNSGGATINNSGTFNNFGTLTNLGTISNFGLFNTSSNVINSGYIDNNDGATITNSRSIMNTGVIANSGTLTDACGGVIDGAGNMTGNQVTAATTCSATTAPVPEFPAEMVVPVLLSALAIVSLVFRRSSPGPAWRAS